MAGKRWIAASLTSKPRLDVYNPNKSQILSFMKNEGRIDGVAEGYVVNYRTSLPVVPNKVDLSFSMGNMCWCLEDVWNLEHNDMELNPEFVEAALAHINGTAHD
jgi:hypothetical protein